MAAGAALALTLSACSSAPPILQGENGKAKQGAIIGAITGAVVAQQTSGDKNKSRNRILGAIAGAAAGTAIGARLDEQERQLREQLAAEQARQEVEVARIDDNNLKLTLNNEVSFDTGSAAIKPSFGPSLDKLAGVLAQYGDFNVMVVGHTDNVGSEAYNQGLSEQRASAVSMYLANKGVAYSRLSKAGRGELEPRADNNTSYGRASNRRVEVFIQGQ